MNRPLRWWLLLAASAAVAGCSKPSPADRFDPRLVGAWRAESGGDAAAGTFLATAQFDLRQDGSMTLNVARPSPFSATGTWEVVQRDGDRLIVRMTTRRQPGPSASGEDGGTDELRQYRIETENEKRFRIAPLESASAAVAFVRADGLAARSGEGPTPADAESAPAPKAPAGPPSESVKAEPAPGKRADRGGADAQIPTPQIAFLGAEARPGPGPKVMEYRLSVVNWSEYPDSLFEPSPDLPPVGRNTEASRTSVDIRRADGAYVYGFCALGKAESLTKLWFAVVEGKTPPSKVYVELLDRRTGKRYKSNVLTISGGN